MLWSVSSQPLHGLFGNKISFFSLRNSFFLSQLPLRTIRAVAVPIAESVAVPTAAFVAVSTAESVIIREHGGS